MSTTRGSPTSTHTELPTETCSHPKPGKNGYLPPEACDVILLYEPSFPAAVLFTSLFGLSVIVHILQAIVYKKKYAWVIIMGASWELLAFVFRVLQTRYQNEEGYAAVHTIMYLLAPLWINAFVYMTLGRLIYFFIPEKRLGGISAKRYGLIFVGLDILAFFVQLGGAVISTQSDTDNKIIMIGIHVYMGGIGMQELFVVIFVGLTIHLHRRMIQMENVGALDMEKANRGSIAWFWLFRAMYAALGLITIRIIFRLAQFARGTDPDNPILTTEAYEYVFDAAPMFLAVGLLNIAHPARVLRGSDSEFPTISRKEKKALKKAKKRARKKNPKEEMDGDFDVLSSQEESYGPRPSHPVII